MEENDDDGVRRKRFKYQSQKESLKEVHLAPAWSQTKFDHDLLDNESHFYDSLEHWRQLNLSPAFLNFAGKAANLSASMPLLVHSWRDIVELWMETLEVADAEALPVLLDLLQRLAHDLRTTLAPVYTEVFGRLLKLLPRSLDAQTLSALLETLSALFRYIALPLRDADVVIKSWRALKGALRKSCPEVQRAVAEVWGNILRRVKADARGKVIEDMAADLNGIEDCCAWVFVYACKSVSQTLHTAAPSIILPLVSFHISCKDPAVSYTLIRRVLTALIHHCKSANDFNPLGEPLISLFTQLAKSMNVNDAQEQFRRILAVLSVPVAVRQGSRMTEKQLKEILIIIPEITSTEALEYDLLNFVVSALNAGQMSTWVGPGRKVIDHVWSSPTFGMKVAVALAETGWGGWKMILLPAVFKMTLSLLENHPKMAVMFLAALAKGDKLGDADIVWRKTIADWVTERLANWKQSEDTVIELSHILALADFVPNISESLIAIVETTLHVDSATEDYNATFANASWVLGSAMAALASLDPDGWADRVDMSRWIRRLTEIWGWSGYVLEGLVTLLKARPSEDVYLHLNDIYETLREAVISHDRRLRLSALRLLASSAVGQSNEKEIIKRCLQCEEISLDVQGVRERALRTSRVSQAVKESEDIGIDICTRWLLSQLKVNLRPLWPAAVEALTSLSARFDNVVWTLAFHEIQAVCQGDELSPCPTWMDDDSAGHEDKALGDKMKYNDPWEEERSWRDPSAHKIRSTAVRWVYGEHSKMEIITAQSQQDHLNLDSYYFQLLTLLRESSGMTEKHNRDLIPLFLSLSSPQASSSLSNQRVTAWLSVLSKFQNPKASYKADELHSLYTDFLSHSDRVIQRTALSCILAYKSPFLIPHEEQLRAFLDETRWRDELVSFDISTIQSQERQTIINVMIRLLFGVMLERKGRSRAGDRNVAVLGFLAGCTTEELGLFVDLMLKPFQADQRSRRETKFVVRPMSTSITPRQQLGFLNLLGNVLEELGPRVVAFWPALLGTTVDIASGAQLSIEHSKHDISDDDAQLEDSDDVPDSMTQSVKTLRSIRSLALRRFGDFFKASAPFEFQPFMSEAFRTSISPRLPLLDRENTQSPSALLDLFHTWSLHKQFVLFLVEYDCHLLPQMYGCLAATNVKPTVISKVLDIVSNVVSQSHDDEDVSSQVLKPSITILLSRLAEVIGRPDSLQSLSNPITQRPIGILSEISNHLTDSSQALSLLQIFLPLLRRPTKTLPEKVKVDILKILQSLFHVLSTLSDSTILTSVKTFETLAQLFQSLRTRLARMALVSTFVNFANVVPGYGEVVDLIKDLNAYSEKRVDDPDFDRRLRAYAALNETSRDLPSRAWLPILYNMLYFIQDQEELAIRSNASQCLFIFIDLVAQEPGSEYQATFLRVLWPGVKNGLRSKNDLVRAEVLGVISHAVSKLLDIASLHEMHPLLAGGDEEANFFNNILHVQVHRRVRALHRLTEYCGTGKIRSSTLADIFIPLIEDFISATSVDHQLAHEAITSIGRIAKWLSWTSYHGLVHKYLKASRERNELERVYVRTLVAVLDNFHFPMEEMLPQENMTITLEADDGEFAQADQASSHNIERGPHTTLPVERIRDAVSNRLLPDLLNHLESRDHPDDNLRIPLTIGIVRVALHLPAPAREAQISRLLTILSQILRSKSSDTRDLVRETFCRISITLGPPYLPAIIRELRGALVRGPQLQVLAYVTHAILVHVTTAEHAQSFHTLDDCVDDVAHISAEVVFGNSSKDVQSEGFKTKMREVRAANGKGLDSMFIMAKFISPSAVSRLLNPIRLVMGETGTAKIMQQVEDMLRRIASGLNSNGHLLPGELLVLCHTLISQNARFLTQTDASKYDKRKRKSDAIVDNKRAYDLKVNHYANNSYRFVVFGLDLFQTAYRRGRFDFNNSAMISRLEPMVAVIGNTLYSTSTPVLVSGVKASAAIVRCPLKSLDKFTPVFVRQIIVIIKQCGTPESELAQTSLKYLGTILRDCPSVQVKETDLTFLLDFITPDLEDHERQASVFAMLRAIIGRKFVVPEMYDLMDKVSEIMVTSQSVHVQEVSRGVLLQFFLDYPQGKGRLRNQMAFLAKNLSYVYESGRKSVMELLHAVISKFQTGLVHEYADLLFVALVMVLANDESPKCREMAAQLIKSLFSRLDVDHIRLVMSHLHAWASQHEQPALVRVSCQVYGLVIDTLGEEILSYISGILADINSVILRSSQLLDMLDDADADNAGIEWQMSYQALSTLAKIFKAAPHLILDYEKIMWPQVVSHLLYPHSWVRLASCRLLGVLFNTVPVVAPPADLPENSPLSSVGMWAVARKLCIQLKSENLDDAMSLQIVKNLFYIGKCFDAIASHDHDGQSGSQAESVEQLEEDENETGEDGVDDDEDDHGLQNDELDRAETIKYDNPLPWLFSTLSYQARSAHIARRNRSQNKDNWSVQPLSVFRWFAAMAAYMEPSRLESFLVHILSPLYRIMEDDTIRDPQMEELKTLATELQDLLQAKVGTTKFAEVYSRIRQKVSGIRHERRATRALRVTVNPAAAAKRKAQKNAVKKTSRKRKNQVFAEGRGRMKRRRED